MSAGRDRRTRRRLQERATVKGSQRDVERVLTRMLREVDERRVPGAGARQRLDAFLRKVWAPHAATRVRPKTHRYVELM